MTTPDIVLRRASIEDLEILRSWDDMPHLKGQVPTSDWHWEEELLESVSWRNQFIAMFGDQPIGYVDIIDPYDEPSQYWGQVSKGIRAIDIWIGAPEYLGQGLGTKMMHEALRFCFADLSVERILIDPLATNTRAHKFYEKVGFVFVEERIFDGDRCFVFELFREDYEKKSKEA